ncbi:MAG: hypothetical protein P8Y80_01940, partial [Acidobacteriota bacterium]
MFRSRQPTVEALPTAFLAPPGEGLGGTTLHSPTIYIIGGETDIAYPQAIDDFAKIDKVPVAIANLEGV